MSAVNKTKEELLIELKELRKENNALKALYEKDIAERKQMEEALRNSEEKYSKAFHTSPYAIIITQAENGKFIEINDAFTTISGFTREEAIADSSIGLRLWVDMEDRKIVVSDLLDGKEVKEKEFQFRKKNGEIIMGLFSAQIIHLNDKPFILSSINDITDWKFAESELSKSETKYRTLFDSIDVGFCIIEVIFDENEKPIDYRFLEINPSFEKQTGLIDAKGKRMRDLAPKHEEHWFEIYGKIALTGEPNRFVNRAEQLHRWYDVYAFRYGQPEKRQVAILFNDITIRKQTEVKLHESQELLNRALEANQTGVWNLNLLDGTANRTLIHDQIFGYQTLLPIWTFDMFLEHVVPEDRSFVEQRFHKATNAMTDWNFECRIRRTDGKVRWILARGSHQRNSEGKSEWMSGLVQDITDRRQVMEDLTIAKEHAEESDRLKSAFLANMSHEIRTPMNGILGFAGLLKEPNLTGEEQQNFIGIIEKSGARMLNIINDIVSISKIESGQMEVAISETNINEKIEEIYTLFKPEVEKKGLRLLVKNTLPSKGAIFKTDREKLYAILTNLVKNAIKFTCEGSIEFGYEKKGQYLEFFVKDTGTGIAQDKQEIIFERFRQGGDLTRRYNEGAGLGLSISKAYVEMLGGKIWVESEEGKGSIFYFNVPYNTEPEAKPVTQTVVPPDLGESKTKNLKILIVEDDEASEMFISIAVKMYGKEFLKAGTGVEAIEVCRNNPDIDLILMDINMPKMDGYEATRQIRQFNKDVVIIAQTAYGLTGDREKSIDAGCNDYISKPIRMIY